MSLLVRPRTQLDILQSMVNAVLIETGKALRSAQQDGRPSVAATTRLKTTMPNFIDNFHQALDDIECDILRAKAVIHRDYKELRAQRLALENPEPILREPEAQVIEITQTETNSTSSDPASNEAATLKDEIKQSSSPEEQIVPDSQITPMKDPSQVSIAVKAQNPTPPSSEIINGTDSKPIGLGVVTDGALSAPGPATAELQNSSIDSLFGPDDNDADDSAMDFEAMDFLQDTSSNAQCNDQSQNHTNEFDLSSFGNTTQDFSMPHLQIATTPNNINNNDNALNNTNNNENTKSNDDPFVSLGSLENSSANNMDIDLGDLGMAGADESVFDDMFFGDDSNLGGGEMEHGEFDNAFFGLDQ